MTDFVSWCSKNGYGHVVKKDLWRRNRKFRKVKALPKNHTNDKRQYYRTEYLLSDHWKALRSEKLRINPACQNCGFGRRLDVHHLRYRNLYDVLVTDLVTLCRRCHEKMHKNNFRVDESSGAVAPMAIPF